MKKLMFAVLLAATMFGQGCMEIPNETAVGGLGGAILGASISNNNKMRNSAIGGVAGAILGQLMNQQRRLKQPAQPQRRQYREYRGSEYDTRNRRETEAERLRRENQILRNELRNQKISGRGSLL